MTARFVVLGSGSSGNASLLHEGDYGVLVDCGLGYRQLAIRLGMAGFTWRSVQAVVLTHTHGDHWKESVLTVLARSNRPIYCHPSHAECLSRHSKAFAKLRAEGLVRLYEPGTWLPLTHELRARAFEVSHDAGPTFGWRFEGSNGLFGPGWAVGYAADLGCWDDDHAQALADVDLLAVEFNHDVKLQRTSGRPKQLIERVLSNVGHLSNDQAAELVKASRAISQHDCLRYVVGLHPSRDCNRAEIALEAARMAAGEVAAVHLATQHEPTPVFTVGARQYGTTPLARPRLRRRVKVTGPGMFDE